MSDETLQLAERDELLEYTFGDLLRYHGPGSPGGVANAFKVLQRALPLLSPDAPCQRREIRIETSFGGPGARDAFEMATRAITDGRFSIDGSMARAELPRTCTTPSGASRASRRRGHFRGRRPRARR